MALKLVDAIGKIEAGVELLSPRALGALDGTNERVPFRRKDMEDESVRLSGAFKVRRELVAAVDLDAETVLGDWVRGSEALGHVALDGKRLRGPAPAGHEGSAGLHLAAAFASRLGRVISQLQGEANGTEIMAALALLKGLPLRGAAVTGDAVFCQQAICQTVQDG